MITKDKFFEAAKEIGGYSYNSGYSVAYLTELLVKEVYMEEREYYANTSDYLVYFVDLNELYNFLTEGMEGKNNGI
jgi:hypothetical protein